MKPSNQSSDRRRCQFPRQKMPEDEAGWHNLFQLAMRRVFLLIYTLEDTFHETLFHL